MRGARALITLIVIFLGLTLLWHLWLIANDSKLTHVRSSKMLKYAYTTPIIANCSPLIGKAVRLENPCKFTDENYVQAIVQQPRKLVVVTVVSNDHDEWQLNAILGASPVFNDPRTKNKIELIVFNNSVVKAAQGGIFVNLVIDEVQFFLAN